MEGSVKSETISKYLVGKLCDKLNDEILPSNKEVLSRFIYSRTTTKRKSVAESLKECANEVQTIWAMANIPTQNHYRVQKNITSLHLKWVGVKKNRFRKTDQQLRKETNFSVLLETIFDVSHNDSLKKMKKDDKLRLMVEGNIVWVTHKLNERKEYWEKLMEKQSSDDVEEEPGVNQINELEEGNENESNCRKSLLQEFLDFEDLPENANDVQDDFNSDIENLSSDYSDLELVSIAADICDTVETDSDEEYVPQNKYRKKMPKKKKIMTPELSAVLDRATISNREAVPVLAVAAFSMGLNPENMVINRESFRQAREINRRQKAFEIQENFKPETPLVLHWDGKLLPDANLKKKVENVAVIVTGNGMTQTLGIPYLMESSGKNQAFLVYETVQKWDNVSGMIEFLCFDTTSLNSGTGKRGGTCLWLQKYFGKRFLWLACRHHIMEIIVSAVYAKALRDQSTGPNMKLFERFRAHWNNIDKSKYESCLQDHDVLPRILLIKDDLIKFVNEQLQNFPTTRDDYKELLILTLIFLGEKPPEYKIGKAREYVVHTCGALHRARWMARLIYSFKIYLYRSQFKLSDVELSGIKEFLIFVVHVYIKNWYQAPSATRAATNDLKLLKDIAHFNKINSALSDAAMEKFSRHLWYLSEELVGIAFFDTSLEISEKVEMVKALKVPGSINPSVRPKINVANVEKYKISDFITSNSLAVLRILNMSQDFLNSDPGTWNDREDFQNARNYIKKLNVVNDVAERGCAMATTLNGKVTKNDEQKQYLIQGVEDQRRKIPNANKKTVLKVLSAKH